MIVNKAFLQFLREIYYRFIYIIYKNDLNKNRELKNKYSGEECFVFMTGPSINDIDLSKFQTKYTFICNHFYRADSIEEMNPTFYSHLENANRTMKADDENERSIGLVKSSDNKCNDADFFLHVTAKKYMRLVKFRKSRKIYYIGTKRGEITEDMEIDFTRVSPFTKGSVYFLLSMAMYMGFKKIYLIGAGYTLNPYQWYHFYEPYDTEEYKQRVSKITNQVPEKEHYTMKKLADNIGAKIINVIPEGYSSPIYESITMEMLKRLVEGDESVQ